MPPSALLGDILPNRLLSSNQKVRHEQNDLINVHKMYDASGRYGEYDNMS